MLQEEDAVCLATKGYVKLTCGVYIDAREVWPTTSLLDVVQIVYDTAHACNLPIQ